jgi:hypothetical protein
LKRKAQSENAETKENEISNVDELDGKERNAQQH